MPPSRMCNGGRASRILYILLHARIGQVFSERLRSRASLWQPPHGHPQHGHMPTEALTHSGQGYAARLHRQPRHHGSRFCSETRAIPGAKLDFGRVIGPTSTGRHVVPRRGLGRFGLDCCECLLKGNCRSPVPSYWQRSGAGPRDALPRVRPGHMVQRGGGRWLPIRPPSW
jgi:hypothetical protein